jgi:hypothetical protein
MFFEHAPDILTIPIVTADPRTAVICHPGQGLLMSILLLCMVAAFSTHRSSTASQKKRG